MSIAVTNRTVFFTKSPKVASNTPVCSKEYKATSTVQTGYIRLKVAFKSK